MKYGYWRTVETSHEWIDDFCSECGHQESAFSGKKECPSCGAVMLPYAEWERKKEEESNDDNHD